MEFSFEQDRRPLAARMRPRTLDEFIGQEQVVGRGRLLRRAIEADQLQSIIFSGPPGTGKTTLARVIAERTRSQFLSVNAVLSGVKDIREAIEKARSYATGTNRRTILFVDEVHRWNKSQQDALLPWVEDGLFILIGATTENPFFEVNRALLSRSRVFLLSSLTAQDLKQVIVATLNDADRGYGKYRVKIEPDAEDHLIKTASGDARTLLNALELAIETSVDYWPPPDATLINVNLAIAEDSIQKRAVLYDKDGDYHFDTISAFIKSVRGSDPDAALYWLARMITAGEDPRYILRRLLILAAEDVGLADPHCMVLVNACAAAFDRVGMPEGQFHLTQATLYCAVAPKSNSTMGYFDALKSVQAAHDGEVPTHLRDPSRDGDQLGHGHGYQYPHAYRDHWTAQQYLPDSLHGTVFYQAGPIGWEGERQIVLEERRQLQLAAEREPPIPVLATSASNTGSSRWLHRVDESVLDEIRSLRDQALDLLSPASTDRVLLCGAPIQAFLGETLRRTPGGRTSVWCTELADLETIRHIVDRSPLLGIEKPDIPDLLRPGGKPDSPGEYVGPFDRILCRPSPLTPPGSLADWLCPLCTDEGKVVFLDVAPLEGTLPSAILPLPPEQLELLKDVEQQLFASRTEQWRTVFGLTTIPRLATMVERTITPDVARAWFGPEQPLGKKLLEVGGDRRYTSLLDQIATLEVVTVTWRRVFLAISATGGNSQ